MFYIIVEHDGKRKVISDAKNNPRIFAKKKKARNFIAGRSFLHGAEIVEDIINVSGRLKVDI